MDNLRQRWECGSDDNDHGEALGNREDSNDRESKENSRYVMVPYRGVMSVILYSSMLYFYFYFFDR